jgi:hypothetical protein
MPETYLHKLVGRTINAMFCPACYTFKPITVTWIEMNRLPNECPQCGAPRTRCVITIEKEGE